MQDEATERARERPDEPPDLSELAVTTDGRSCRHRSDRPVRVTRRHDLNPTASNLHRRHDPGWQRFGEHHDRGRLATEIAPIQTELRALLTRAAPKRPKNKHHRRFANNLLKIWPALRTFVTVEGVEPTNNQAERSLRGPVIQRRLSHVTRTQNGERFTEGALSASVTCRLQRRSLYTYLCDLLTAHARGDPLPTLT